MLLEEVRSWSLGTTATGRMMDKIEVSDVLSSFVDPQSFPEESIKKAVELKDSISPYLLEDLDRAEFLRQRRSPEDWLHSTNSPNSSF